MGWGALLDIMKNVLVPMTAREYLGAPYTCTVFIFSFERSMVPIPIAAPALT